MRKPGLDLLRAIAVVWVMLFHSWIVGGLGVDWDWLSRYGWMGVDLFFVLSGFLIGGQLLAPLARGEPLDFRAFYLRRGLRILPAFWTVLALYLAFPILREAPGMEPWWKFGGFFMNLSIDYSANATFSHAWSLCVEEHFYLVFPLLAWWLSGRMSARRFVLLCVAVVLAGMALRCGLWVHDVMLENAGAGPSRNWFVEDLYFPTWSRLDGLLAGVMLAVVQVYRPMLLQRWLLHANAALLAGVMVLAMAMWLFRVRTDLTANTLGWPLLSLGMALLVLAAASPHGWIGSRRIPGVGWLAAVSFSLYLSHKIVFHMVELTLGAALQGMGLLAFAVYAVATLLGGALLYYAVERPFLRLRGRLPGLRRAPAREMVRSTADA